MLWLWALVSVLGAGVLYQAAGTWWDARRHPLRGRMVPIGKRCLHCVARGRGTPTVVLESGLAASSLSWALVQDRIAEFTRVLSYDRAGLGWSPAGSGRLCVENIVVDFERLIDAEAPDERVVLVGHSFGGLLVRAFAQKRPERVAGIVLLDPVSVERWGACGQADRRRLATGARLSRRGAWLASFGIVRLCLMVLAAGHTGLPRLIAKASAGQGQGIVSRLTGEMTRLPAALWPAIRAHWSRPGSFHVMAQYLDALPECACAMQDVQLAPEIAVTVLSAAGATEAEWQERERWIAQSERGKHVQVPNCGHWIQLEQPEMVVDSVREMVMAIRSGSAV